MLKYLIVPRWLFIAFTTNNTAIQGLLNFDVLESILSPEELTFYIQCNVRTYNDFFVNKNTNHLLKLLNTPECENQIRCRNEFINYIDGCEKKPVSNVGFTEGLVNNPIYPLKKDIDNRKLFLEVKWIGIDVLGFIPTTKDLDLKEYSVRRDIYQVMRRQMSVDDILHSPIFGI